MPVTTIEISSSLRTQQSLLGLRRCRVLDR